MNLTDPDRNTPACVGRRYFDGGQVTVMWEHPRLRGEKSQAEIPAKAILGTPPPARGEGRPLSIKEYETGNTPACAGRSPC